jgi:hypothetical protein
VQVYDGISRVLKNLVVFCVKPTHRMKQMKHAKMERSIIVLRWETGFALKDHLPSTPEI